MTADSTGNRLINEKSLYLKQHAHDPIDWWPYSPEAIQTAIDQDKPIFLSIGYSSCHWCHNMSRDTFCRDDIAEIMNQNFICIKVDREEHPDIDSYYQLACQLYSHTGGWPLSAFVLPENMLPFFAGTYYPPYSTKEHTGFLDILNELANIYQNDRDVAKNNAQQVAETIEKGLLPKDKVDYHGHFPVPMAILDAVKEFYDNENGGFGQAPKFPQFALYEWALEQMLEGMIDKEKGDHIVKTLERMLMGGIYDHARGGIHRYATDEKWNKPHFEKMLYDQAGLLRTLAKFGLIYPSPIVFDSIIQTLEYIDIELKGDDNVLFSAQDAESEGIEGLYFVFSEQEFEDAIKEAEEDQELLMKNMDKLKKWFRISKEGNYAPNLNVLNLSKDDKKDIFTQEGWELVRSTKKALLGERKNRIPPVTDTKGISSWNFQMVSALIDVVQYSQIEVIKKYAYKLFNEVLDGCYKTFLTPQSSPEGDNKQGMTLKRTTTRDDNLPYFEDYVFFSELQLRTFEITGNPVFKTNFADTIQFIVKEFISNDRAKTRALITNDHALYPNQDVSFFDGSFKSPAATLVHLVRKASVLLEDKDLLDSISLFKETMIHEILKNPLNGGEALRALTYPDEVYKVVKVPAKWTTQDDYMNFISYFLPRFTFDYHTDEDEKWQICSFGQCELQGNGFDEFVKTLRPEDPKQEESQPQ